VATGARMVIWCFGPLTGGPLAHLSISNDVSEGLQMLKFEIQKHDLPDFKKL
jgi:hypothetical protein